MRRSEALDDRIHRLAHLHSVVKIRDSVNFAEPNAPIVSVFEETAHKLCHILSCSEIDR